MKVPHWITSLVEKAVYQGTIVHVVSESRELNGQSFVTLLGQVAARDAVQTRSP